MREQIEIPEFCKKPQTKIYVPIESFKAFKKQIRLIQCLVFFQIILVLIILIQIICSIVLALK